MFNILIYRLKGLLKGIPALLCRLGPVSYNHALGTLTCGSIPQGSSICRYRSNATNTVDLGYSGSVNTRLRNFLQG